MQFTDGARVILPDQKEAGRLKRVIIDPKSLQVTDIVVSRSGSRADEKVIPVHLVDSSTEDKIYLKELPGGWDQLAPYEETNYLLINQQDLFLPADIMNHTAPILFIYPPSIPTTGAVYPRPESTDLFINPLKSNTYQREEKLPTLPGDEVLLIPGSRVISQDGVELGYVEHIITRPEDGRVTFFVLKRGLLVKERKLVPVSWVDYTRGQEVQLGVRARFMDWLPDESEAA